jgi:hypothetical protein
MWEMAANKSPEKGGLARWEGSTPDERTEEMSRVANRGWTKARRKERSDLMKRFWAGVSAERAERAAAAAAAAAGGSAPPGARRARTSAATAERDEERASS